MALHLARSKYKVLFWGYALLWGAYFGGRYVQYLQKETASGEVTNVYWKGFTVSGPRQRIGSSGSYRGSYQCPEVQFRYKLSAADTGILKTVTPEALSFREYQPGNKIGVIFPHGRPEEAKLFSLGEYWFVPSYVIILSVASLFWSIGFFVVVFKPWKGMDDA